MQISSNGGGNNLTSGLGCGNFMHNRFELVTFSKGHASLCAPLPGGPLEAYIAGHLARVINPVFCLISVAMDQIKLITASESLVQHRNEATSGLIASFVPLPLTS